MKYLKQFVFVILLSRKTPLSIWLKKMNKWLLGLVTSSFNFQKLKGETAMEEINDIVNSDIKTDSEDSDSFENSDMKTDSEEID